MGPFESHIVLTLTNSHHLFLLSIQSADKYTHISEDITQQASKILVTKYSTRLSEIAKQEEKPLKTGILLSQ